MTHTDGERSSIISKVMSACRIISLAFILQSNVTQKEGKEKIAKNRSLNQFGRVIVIRRINLIRADDLIRLRRSTSKNRIQSMMQND